MIRPFLRLCVVFFLGLGLGSQAWAATTLRVKGELVNAQGKPLLGLASLEFLVLDLDRGGREVWRELKEVRVASGRYAVLLGDSRPMPLRNLLPGWRLTVRPPLGSGWVASRPSLDASEDPRRTQLRGLLERFGVVSAASELAKSNPRILTLLGAHRSDAEISQVRGEEFSDPLPDLYSGAEEETLSGRWTGPRSERVSDEKARRWDRVISAEDSFLRDRLLRMARDFKDRPPEPAGALRIGISVQPH